jgi:hypothetical protein
MNHNCFSQTYSSLRFARITDIFIHCPRISGIQLDKTMNTKREVEQGGTR